MAELAILPLDKGEHLSSFVALVINEIKKSGLLYEIGPMGTTIEGEWEDVIRVIDSCVKQLKRESDRVYLVIKVDYRSGDEIRMKKKVASVKKLVVDEE